MGDELGAKNRCRLTQIGLEKLEKALTQRKVSSNSQLATMAAVDRDTIAKIRDPKRAQSVWYQNLVKCFDIVDLQLLDDDYEADSLITQQKLKLTKGILELNPFGETGAISNPKNFWNRQELLREIFEEIEKGSNQSLVGKSGVGKSSILKMICHEGGNKLKKRKIEKYIYLDMRVANDEKDFFEMLCKAIEIEPLSGSQLSRALRGRQYVVCIDEVKCLSNSTFFTGREINQLSGLSDGAEQPLILVVSSREPLEEVFPETSSFSSTFPGLFSRVDIDEFTKKNLRDFINAKLHEIGIEFNESHIEKIWESSDGNPRRIQQEAGKIFREILSIEA